MDMMVPFHTVCLPILDQLFPRLNHKLDRTGLHPPIRHCSAPYPPGTPTRTGTYFVVTGRPQHL